MLVVLKPLQCEMCQLRFPDTATLESHVNFHHSSSNQVSKVKNTNKIHQQSMKVDEFKKELWARGASVSGDKAHLIRRMEGILASS